MPSSLACSACRRPLTGVESSEFCSHCLAPLPGTVASDTGKSGLEDPALVSEPAEVNTVRFTVLCRRDPDGGLRGHLSAELGQGGLRLTRKHARDIIVPRGTAASYRGGNQFLVRVGDRPVTLAVVGFRTREDRLARDAVEFLGRRRTTLWRGDYDLPWSLFVPSILPLGILFMTGGGLIPGALAGMLVAVCLWIMKKSDWPVLVRLLVVFAVNGLAYAAVVFLWASVAILIGASSSTAPRR